jgi:hypothetical protein
MFFPSYFAAANVFALADVFGTAGFLPVKDILVVSACYMLL